MYPRTIKEAGNHYVNMEPRTVLCHVVQLKDAVNLDIHLIDAESVETRYGSAISNRYVYQTVDRRTLRMSEDKEGIVFRARLSGIVIRDGRDCPTEHDKNLFEEMKTRTMQEIQHQMIRWLNITGNIFKCECGSIDIYNRILVKLYDPVTGLSMNDYLLHNYPGLFMSYGT